MQLTDSEYEHLAELRHQLRRFLAFSESQARAAELEPRQHQLLLAVRAHREPPTIGALAERLVLKHHSAVELVDRLEHRGLVKRARSQADRRVAHVELTPRGRSVLERLTVSHRDELGRAGPDLLRALRTALRNNEPTPRRRRKEPNDVRATP